MTNDTNVRTLPGSFGSRNGQSWSRSMADHNSLHQPSELAAGTYGSVMRIEPHIVLRAIEAQMCPWCGAGPYKVLAGHTSRAHEISPAELRELAGLPAYGVSICSPERSAKARTALQNRDDWEAMRTSGNAKANANGAATKGAKSRVQKLAEANASRDADIIKSANEGETVRSIAERHGVRVNTVGAVLRRNGFTQDRRGLAAKIRRERSL
jgi:hypothetical protein